MGGLPTNKIVNSLATDPSNPLIMYVATGDGLFKSADAGTTWKALAEKHKDLAAIAINPKTPNEIYTATAQGMLSKSADGGTKWKPQPRILVK